MRLSVDLLTVGYCSHCERMTRSSGRWRSVVFPSLCVLLTHPTQGSLLYDTGYAGHFFTATQPFPERLYRWATPTALPTSESLSVQLAVRGLRPTDIRICFISHFHADHIAGLRDLPSARFVCMQEDFAVLKWASRIGALSKGLLPALLPDNFEARLDFAEAHPLRPLTGVWSALGSGYDLLGDGSLMAVPLPGHSPRQMGLCLTDAQGRDVLLCADAVWSRHAWEALELPAWPTRLVMHNWRDYQRTLMQLSDLAQRKHGLVILPSHCTQSIASYRASSAVA